jgi:NitT/TauT family transport system substrate-binding protein
MRAYIRAVRFYNDALRNGRLDGPAADEVIAILSESTPVKSREIYKLITPTGMNPDGHVNRESLAYDLAFYAEQGLIKGEGRFGRRDRWLVCRGGRSGAGAVPSLNGLVTAGLDPA